MKIAMYVALFIVFCIILAAAYVRLAPTDVARWHQSITAEENVTLKGGAIRVIEGDASTFEQLDEAMRALPRTEVLAGSIAEGRITYVTRSKLWGFPDYTTVEYADGVIKLFGRLRFGNSDLGVNAARLGDVLATLDG
ncbi:DUF1499 domain-containing protein [Tateyamaria armeniaca]|uniref:DUF1499 domain-containing protein n=1 Tax=Tateyamaria armeniaca TaxID=2518930 RepID=A0ABW8UWM1_9RHOB